ncbi:MAG: hypothetical protein KAT16_05750 [Candidatus Heimdallarchaeota archaeon]|nr:hypothetical protein [Candidatus Heimdallarchaeota archaeon]
MKKESMIAMSSEIIEEVIIKKKYSIISRHYELLGNRLKEKLIELLEKNHIPFITVRFRVKAFDSFFQKIKKSDNKDPFDRINDICGLRIICYYYSDLFRISQLIRDEFKNQILDFDAKMPRTEKEIVQFGYRSWHYLLKFNDEWIKDIVNEGQYNFRAEIQIRTSIMDAWGSVEHALAYKKDIPISSGMKRRFARISALLEMVDEQFDQLREEKEQYLDSRTFKSHIDFDNQELTFENFQKLLDTFFPYRTSSYNDSQKLFLEITESNVRMKDLVFHIKRAKEILPVLEEDTRKLFLAQNKLPPEQERLLRMLPLKQNQVGAVRNILLIFHDGFWEVQRVNVPEFLANFTIKWRNKLRGK